VHVLASFATAGLPEKHELPSQNHPHFSPCHTGNSAVLKLPPRRNCCQVSLDQHHCHLTMLLVLPVNTSPHPTSPLCPLTRATYKAYKAVWSEACLQTWKDNITTKQALLTALSTGRQQLLSMHILWSLQELSTHSTQLQQLLPSVATPIELGLMQKLRQRGGAGQGWALGVTGAPVGGGEAAAAAQCAVLLQRWMSAGEGTW